MKRRFLALVKAIDGKEYKVFLEGRVAIIEDSEGEVSRSVISENEEPSGVNIFIPPGVNIFIPLNKEYTDA